ncbi:MAG: bacillithiol biosynthesis cysteine-adding enzyme BshC [Bacilli bacterium]|nr:bacillithiol biosynthesis cysteine-adding enzyme BshC [Bacilli bacterium]
MRTELYLWPKNQALAEDYCKGLENASGFFTYHPSNEDSWYKRAQWLDQASGPNANRAELVETLLKYNTKIANSAAAMDNIARLRDSAALVVVGGQQTGLFTGPLLVIYKAITLIQTAKHAERKLGRSVIPIFWLAGEDHDFDEVNHTYVLTPQLEIAKIKIEHPTGIRTSVSQLTIESWEGALQQLDASLMQTEFKAGLMEKLAQIGKQSHTLVDFFAQIMAWLFSDQGLVMLDSDDPEMRRVESKMFSLLLHRHKNINEALLAGRNRVEAAGYKAQTELAANNVNLFVFTDQGERVLLQWDGQLFHDKKKERTYTQQQLNEWAVSAPERFSNNVMTRPLMQDFLFPVLATVLGPGEIAYWGLTGLAFEELGMKMPIVVPRMEFTLVEGAVQKQMDKFGLTWDTVFFHFEQWKKDWLTAQDQLGLPARFAEVKQQFQNIYAPILQTIASINPGLQKLGDTNAQKIVEQIEFLEARSVEANQVQFEAAIRHLERIRLSLLPLEKPQERVYNVLSYLNKYGDGWLKQLLELPLVVNGMHSIIYL